MNKAVTIIIAFFCVIAAHGETPLINQAILNGGFETGFATPWGDITVVGDSDFAQSGDYYGVTEGLRSDVFQFFPVSNANGFFYILSFWARVPEVDGFTSLTVRWSDHDFSQSAELQILSEPELSSTKWSYFSYALRAASSWDDSGNCKISLKFGRLSGSTPTGRAFLDNISLIQYDIPSVSTGIELSTLGGMALS